MSGTDRLPEATASLIGRPSNEGTVRLPLSWELFVFGIAILSLTNLVLYLLVRSDAVAQVVAVMDISVTIVFVADFLARLTRATNRRAYLFHGFGWLDLISCLPGFRVIRLVRVLNVIQRIQVRGGLDAASDEMVVNRPRAILLFVVLMTVAVIEFGSMAMLAIEEPVAGSNIKTASDALWYLVVTISTIGYGDKYPITDLGRIMGTVVLVTGVALFSTLTGYLAHFFYSAGQGERRIARRRQARLARKAEQNHIGDSSP